MTTDETNDLPPSPRDDPGAGDVSPVVSPAQLVRAMFAAQKAYDAMTQFLAEAHTSRRLMTRGQALAPAHAFLAAYVTLVQDWTRFAQQVTVESAVIAALRAQLTALEGTTEGAEGAINAVAIAADQPDAATCRQALALAGATLVEHAAVGQQVHAFLEDVQTRSQALLATYGQEQEQEVPS